MPRPLLKYPFDEFAPRTKAQRIKETVLILCERSADTRDDLDSFGDCDLWDNEVLKYKIQDACLAAKQQEEYDDQN